MQKSILYFPKLILIEGKVVLKHREGNIWNHWQSLISSTFSEELETMLLSIKWSTCQKYIIIRQQYCQNLI